MEEEEKDYHYYMAQAEKYREMADNLDGYQRQTLLGAVQDMKVRAKLAERKAENLKE